MRIPISEINVNPGRRELDPEDVKELAGSIREVGLLHPIIVDKKYTLIAGLHRLEAVKLLEWTEIECTVSSLEGLKAELAEIDENVIRSDLSAVEFGELLLRRKEIYETIHPETKNGGDRKSEKIRTTKCRSDFAARSFVQDTAEKLGVTPRTVERQIQTAKNLTQETKDILQGANTKLGKQTALKLSRLAPEQQQEAASMLAAGQIRSVEQYKAAKSAGPNSVQMIPADDPKEEVPSQSETVPTKPAAKPDSAPQPALPYRLPDKRFNSFEESIADLKDPDKDCSCTPDIFLAEYSGFIQKFTKDIKWYSTPQYEAVFPALTQIQIDYLRSLTKALCDAAEELLHQVERKNSA